MKALELKIPPPIFALIVGVLMWTATKLPPAVQPPGSWRFFLVGGLFILALSTAGRGIAAFRRAQTTANPLDPDQASKIVSTGIYGRTRNPMYLGLTVLLTGWAVWLWSPWGALGPVLFFLYMTRFQIMPEERALTAKFGQEYLTYRQQVRRWL
jgi:protein-S-isoprenylcysteine O-methyltransferase Ste14